MTEKTGKGKANFNMKFESFHGNEVANNEKLRECGMKKKTRIRRCDFGTKSQALQSL